MEALTFKLEKIVKASHDSLDDFEGPLDLILYLLSKNKIEIKDIQVSEILDQYLDYLDRMKKMDLDIASDFVAMASHLLYIKVRMLLSIHDQEANEEMDMLIQTLEERRRQEDYRRIQYACQYLSERYAVGKDLFIRNPEPLKKNKKYEYRHEPDELSAALLAMSGRLQRKIPPPVSAFSGIVGHEIYPVGNKITDLIKRLARLGTTKIKAFFSESASRSEIVATFLAVLELCRDRKVSVSGENGDYSLALSDEKEA